MIPTQESCNEKCVDVLDVTAFERGYLDEGKGLGFLDNPFDTHSIEGRRWIDGYVKSMQDKRACLYHSHPSAV